MPAMFSNMFLIECQSLNKRSEGQEPDFCVSPWLSFVKVNFLTHPSSFFSCRGCSCRSCCCCCLVTYCKHILLHTHPTPLYRKHRLDVLLRWLPAEKVWTVWMSLTFTSAYALLLLCRCMQEHICVFCLQWWSVTFPNKFTSVLWLKAVTKKWKFSHDPPVFFSFVAVVLLILHVLLYICKILLLTEDFTLASLCNMLMTDVAMLQKKRDKHMKVQHKCTFYFTSTHHICEM